MGLYSDYSTAELHTEREVYRSALRSRLTDPARVSAHGRDVTFQQGNVAELRKELAAINAELTRREGGVARGPIYLMG
ncbi:MAG: hypothetical protein K2X79_09180 [Burkholderiaceae bacterium]|nr:hypothetical protein [Burkholderiaceae bacterium]